MEGNRVKNFFLDHVQKKIDKLSSFQIFWHKKNLFYVRNECGTNITRIRNEH